MTFTTHLLKKYSLISLLFFFCATAWGQTNNQLKYLTSKNDSNIPKGNYEGISTKLAIHPAAKALLDKVAQPDKTTQYQSTDALSQLFGTTSTAPAFLNNEDQEKDLLITRDQHNVPIFIKGYYFPASI